METRNRRVDEKILTFLRKLKFFLSLLAFGRSLYNRRAVARGEFDAESRTVALE